MYDKKSSLAPFYKEYEKYGIVRKKGRKLAIYIAFNISDLQAFDDIVYACACVYVWQHNNIIFFISSNKYKEWVK